MKKKYILKAVVLSALCATGLSFVGCRSRITAKMNADEIIYDKESGSLAGWLSAHMNDLPQEEETTPPPEEETTTPPVEETTPPPEQVTTPPPVEETTPPPEQATTTPPERETPPSTEEETTTQEDKPAEKSEEPTTQEDKPMEKSEEPTTQEDKPMEKSEEPTTQEDRPTEKSEEPTTQEDRPTEKSEEPATQEDRPTEKSEEPTTQEDRPTEKSEDPTTQEDKPTEKSEEPTQGSEKVTVQPDDSDDNGTTENNNSESGTGENPTNQGSGDNGGDSGSGGDGGNGDGGENGSGGNGENGDGGDNGGGDKDPSESSETPSESSETPSESSEEPAKEITVILDAAGGRADPFVRRLTLRVGGRYTGLPSNVNRGGYTFAGWYTEPNGGGRKIDESSPVTSEEDHTLYAYLVRREAHTVRFHFSYLKTKNNLNACWFGSMDDSAFSATIYVGNTYSYAASNGNTYTRRLSNNARPTLRTGYTFDGWYTAPQGEGGQKVDLNDVFSGHEDVDLYVHLTYDPVSYWAGVMNNFNAYPCQIRALYIEESDNYPITYSMLLAQTKSENVAKRFSGDNVTDGFIINDWRPSAIIKLTNNFDNAAAIYDEMIARFPNKEIYVVQREGEWGNSKVMLMYALRMKATLYPDAAVGNGITEELLQTAAEELGVNAKIYTRN